MRPVALRQIKPTCQNLLSYVSQATLAVSVISSRKFSFILQALKFLSEKKTTTQFRKKERKRKGSKEKKEGRDLKLIEKPIRLHKYFCYVS